jgi:UDP-N-acetylmuramoylalanine--D-glutamate ligase
MNENLKNKKVLLMGLGILGGGVATARFLVEKGANLTVTDMKNEKDLEVSILKLKDLKGQIRFVLGRHEEEDFLNNEIVVINPDVPADNKFVEMAREAGKQIENELTLFYKFAPCKQIVGITGTRGKTTTTNWIGAILKMAGKEVRVVGNDPEKTFLSEIYNCSEQTIAVIETPSFQLEIFGDSGLAPHVAVITNLYQDHLSRHKTMEGYALTKANIFKNQTKDDFLILNKDNEWTKFFLDQKPKAKVIFPSDIDLPSFDKVKFAQQYGNHNLQNFLAAASACVALGVRVEEIVKASESLPLIKWRQELVFERDNLKIYNDTAATSPEACIVAIDRYKKEGQDFFIIAGGTDRELDFKEWGKFVNENLKPENIVLLAGSATEKMKKELKFVPAEFETLEECFSEVLKRADPHKDTNIVFSPGAKSFEKFKNEFDRGEKFNAMVQSTL